MRLLFRLIADWVGGFQVLVFFFYGHQRYHSESIQRMILICCVHPTCSLRSSSYGWCTNVFVEIRPFPLSLLTTYLAYLTRFCIRPPLKWLQVIVQFIQRFADPIRHSWLLHITHAQASIHVSISAATLRRSPSLLVHTYIPNCYHGDGCRVCFVAWYDFIGIPSSKISKQRYNAIANGNGNVVLWGELIYARFLFQQS